MSGTREMSFIEIAKGLGGSIARSFPWKDFQEALKDAIKGVFLSKRGSIEAKDFDEFWQALVEQGGWWDPLTRLGSGGRNSALRQESLSFSPRPWNDGSKRLAKKDSKGLDQILQELRDRSQRRQGLSSPF